MHRLVILLVLLGGPSWADDRMTASEFDAYVTGRTITFRNEIGDLYGVERYMEGRRVMWSTFEGICRYGVWYESKGDICFRYDHDTEPQCWAIYDDPGGLRVEFTTRPNTTVIYEMPEREDALICNDLSS